jgi:hypothetical protein
MRQLSQNLSAALEAWVKANKDRGVIIDRLEYAWELPSGDCRTSSSAHFEGK